MQLDVRLVWLFLPSIYLRSEASAAKTMGLTVFQLRTLTGINPPPFRIERSDQGYGTHLWLWRVRIGSRKTMSEDYQGPRIFKGGDEFCNDTLCFHLYPMVSIDVWWRWKQRTVTDGMCDRCKDELREGGWSDEAIANLERQQISSLLGMDND